MANILKSVHISKLRCWTCQQLKRNPYGDGYHCLQNPTPFEFHYEGFAEKCDMYMPRSEVPR